MEEIDFDVLANPTSRRFLIVLRSIQSLDDLPDETVGRFYTTLLSHFQKPISKVTGNAILTAISKFLMEGTVTGPFVNCECWKLLPFNKEDFAEAVFDIIMILVCHRPDFATADFVDFFEMQIPLNPMKALTILARFAQKFKEVDDPLTMLDVLISKFDLFKERETVIQYLALVTYLCRQFDDYQSERSQYCWLKICKLLKEEEDTEVLKSCYGALFAISSVSKSRYGFKLQAVNDHMRMPELTEFVLPFLIVCSEMLEGEEIIETLLEIAELDDKATLVLMRMCENDQNAKVIASFDYWLDRPLPSILDTLKLLYTVLGHLPTKEKTSLVNSDNFYKILKLGAVHGGTQVLSMIYGIVQRMVLTKKRLARFVKEKIFSAFFKSSDNANSITADRAMYRMFRIVARIDEVEELHHITQYAVKDVELNGELMLDAMRYLADVCKYSTSRAVMLQMNILKLCEPLQNDKQFGPCVQTIFANLIDNDSDE